MEATGVIKRSSVNNDPQAGIDTSYDTSLAHIHVMPAKGPEGDKTFRCTLKGIRLGLSSISGASAVFMTVSEDEDGDIIIVPETEATISIGITTATNGAVVYKVDLPIWTLDGSTLYIHVKTDAGTVTLADSQITFEVT